MTTTVAEGQCPLDYAPDQTTLARVVRLLLTSGTRSAPQPDDHDIAEAA
jgi:hypothetical protein